MVSLSIAMIVCVILLRAFPRFVWAGLDGADTWFHRAYINLIRDGHHRVPRKIPRFLIPSRVTYPALYHWILSFLPDRGINFIDRFGALLFDLTAAVLTAQLLVTGGHIPKSTAPFLVALYLIAPGLTMVHIGPRAYALTPRNFAQLLYALWFIALANLVSVDDGWLVLMWEGIVVSLLVGLLLSSKFAIQVLIVTLPAVAIVLGPSDTLVQGSMAVVFAIAVSRGFFVKQICGQLGHLRWYIAYNQPFVRHRGNWQRLLQLVRKRALRNLVGELLFHNRITSGVVRHTLMFFVLFWSLGDVESLDAVQHVALVMCLAGTSAWVATSWGVMRVFGEAERYLEFAFPAQWFLFWSVIPGEFVGTSLVVVGFCFAALYALNLKIISFQASLRPERDRAEMAGKISSFSEPILLCLDEVENYYFFLNTNAKLCAPAKIPSLRDISLAYFQERYWKYPYINPRSLEEICRLCKVDLLLMKKSAAQNLERRAKTQYDLTRWKQVHENPSYALYERSVSYA
jgi:hypothetical protein